MYNYSKQLKSKKKRNFTQIQNTYNYMYFCRLNDLSTNQLTIFKKELKQYGINVQCIKVKLIIQKISTLKSQNSTLILFFNEFNQFHSLKSFFKSNNFFQPLFLIRANTIISQYKLTRLDANTAPIPFQLKKTIFNFYATLLQINDKFTADIT